MCVSDLSLRVWEMTTDMRKHAKWLTQTDERILEFLLDEGNYPPTAISRELSAQANSEAMKYHPNHVGRRCRELANYGLVVNVGSGTYSITDDGRAYLSGDLDASSLDASE